MAGLYKVLFSQSGGERTNNVGAVDVCKALPSLQNLKFTPFELVCGAILGHAPGLILLSTQI